MFYFFLTFKEMDWKKSTVFWQHVKCQQGWKLDPLCCFVLRKLTE